LFAAEVGQTNASLLGANLAEVKMTDASNSGFQFASADATSVPSENLMQMHIDQAIHADLVNCGIG
jgi:hypothetical protein